MLSVNTIQATNILFMLSKGLNLLQVNLVNIFYMGSVFLLEIPTGAVSDMFGRKRSFLIACLFMSFSFFIYFFSGSLLFFALAEIVAAIGMTFHSGALEAWFVDSLDANGYTQKKDRLFGRAATLASGMSIVAGLSGAFLGSRNLAYPFLAGAVLALATLWIGYLLMEEVHLGRENLSLRNGASQMKKIIGFSITYGVKNKVVLFLIIPGAISMFAYMAVMQYWQPYFQEIANTQQVGLAWVALSLGLMVGSLLVHWTSLFKRYHVLILSTVLCAATPLVLGLSNYFVLSLPLFFLYFVGRGTMLPTRKAYINDHIPAETRATILSFDSMICRGAAALGLIIFGVIAERASIIGSWYVASVVILLGIPALFMLRRSDASSHGDE
ncbi:MAG: MFS transporter [Theionarchaea archaeon]|nr:MFS transporter [Theionarchaea archaeon]MBU7037194.1 MFS transporter [Theionarchaea archaeon]